MPQVFQVLKCYKCSVFQIHQTKKSNKFECKVCGEKQSIKRHYGIGTGKDCRLHVQRLNSLRGDIDNATITNHNYNSDEENDDSNTDEGISENTEYSIVTQAKRSKWSAYVDKPEIRTENESEKPMFLGDSEVLLEFPQKRKSKKFKGNIKSSTDLQDNENLHSSNYQYTYVDNEHQHYKNNFYDNKLENGFNAIENSAHSDINHHYEKQVIVNTLINSDKRKFLQTEDELKTINKTSKWVQFVEKDEENEVMVETLKSDNLFSLCDDNDIDSVLSI